MGQLILKEKMMGHDGLISLNKNYFREHLEELIEEYIPAIQNLTIDDSERLKIKNEKLEKEKSELEITRIEMEEMKRE